MGNRYRVATLLVLIGSLVSKAPLIAWAIASGGVEPPLCRLAIGFLL